LKPRVRRILFARILRAGWPVAILLFLPVDFVGQATETRVVCLTNLTDSNRQELTHKLQKITGWSDLEFDRDGTLRKGDEPSDGGSAGARLLVAQAMSGPKTIVIEGASRDTNVVFSRVLPARWKDDASNSSPVFVIQIDFADFQHVTGDRIALQAFDVGWVVLHEFDHIVNDSIDANHSGEPGECEEHINLIRRECNLPERGDYFFTFLPTARDSVFAAHFVRLAFEKELTGTRRKYWLVWDANLVGGLGEKQIASLR
jgi:hypothetical protein